MNNEFKMEEAKENEPESRINSSIEQKANSNKLEIQSPLKLVEKNHKFKFNNPLRQINNLPILNEDINLENVEKILLKKPKERTAKELKIVTKFIENTELSQKFKKDKMSVHSLERLLNFCAMYMEFQKLEPNTILFRQGDHGDKFFIILRGSVNILRIVKKTVSLLPIEYINYIDKVYKSGNKDLISKNLKENYDVYYIEMKEIEFLNEIIFAITIKNLPMKTSIDEILKILTDFNRNPAEYDIDTSKKNYSDPKEFENLIDLIKGRVIGKLNFLGINLRKYNYIHTVKEKKKMSIYDEEIFLVFNEGKCFGDFALDSQSNVRTASIQGGENTTYLGYITNKIYCEYLLHEKQKLRKKEMAFILDFNIFDSISFTHFDRKYFSDFTFHECLRGENLFKENDELDYVYLIKEGEFELFFHKNTNSLIDIIEKFEKVYYESFKQIVNNDMFKVNKKKIIKEKSRNIKVLIYGKKQFIGIYEYYFKQNIFFDCRVFSEKASYFKIKASNLEKIFTYEEPCRKNLEFYVKNNFSHLIQRLNYILKTNLISSKKYDMVENPIKIEEIIPHNYSTMFPNIISQSHIQPQIYKTKLNSLNQTDTISSVSKDKKKVIPSISTREIKSLKMHKNSSSRLSLKSVIFSKEKIKIEENNESDFLINNSFSIDLEKQENKNNGSMMLPINSNVKSESKVELDSFRNHQTKKSLEKNLPLTSREITRMEEKILSSRVNILNMNDENFSEIFTERKNKNDTSLPVIKKKKLIVTDNTSVKKIKKVKLFSSENKIKRESVTKFISEKEITADLSEMKNENLVTFKHLFKFTKGKYK